MKVDRDEACKRPHPSTRRGAKRTSDPESSPPLHTLQLRDEALNPGLLEVPQAIAVCSDWHDASAIQEPLLHRKQPPIRVPKHAHGANRGQSLGTVVTNVLFEIEPLVKVKAQVPPIRLGLEGGVPSVGRESQIQAGVLVVMPSGEVEYL